MSEYSGLKPKVMEHVIGLMDGSELSAEVLLADAAHKASPLHGFFEWTDSVAAKQYRLYQAEGVIRRVKVNVIREPEKVVRVRAFAAKVDLGQHGERGVYVAVSSAGVAGDDESRAALEDAMRRDIARLQARYRNTELLFKIWDEEAGKS